MESPRSSYRIQDREQMAPGSPEKHTCAASQRCPCVCCQMTTHQTHCLGCPRTPAPATSSSLSVIDQAGSLRGFSVLWWPNTLSQCRASHSCNCPPLGTSVPALSLQMLDSLLSLLVCESTDCEVGFSVCFEIRPADSWWICCDCLFAKVV